VIIGAKDNVIRVLVLDNYSLHYRINKTIVEIVSFWANKKEPSNL